VVSWKEARGDENDSVASEAFGDAQQERLIKIARALSSGKNRHTPHTAWVFIHLLTFEKARLPQAPRSRPYAAFGE